MNKKQHIQAAIDALKKITNDDLIADIVADLEAHAETLTDEGEEDSGGSNPPPGKERP